MLNNQLNEPEILVFHPWDLYECTANERTGRYHQSTVALLIDVPSQQVLDSFGTFPICIAPPGTHNVGFLNGDSERPTTDELQEIGRNEVSIGSAPERELVVHKGFQG